MAWVRAARSGVCLPPLRDDQRAWPTAWCRRCRGEIYRGEGPLCPACREELARGEREFREQERGRCG